MDFATFVRELQRARRGNGIENLIIFSVVPSTNLVARRVLGEYLKEGEDAPAALFLAHEQSRGRGRQGRGWWSPAGMGVYASLLVGVERREELATLPLLVPVGLCRELNRHLDGRCGLKWPNDLLVEGRKIGGVLIEALYRRDGAAGAAVGIGINHGQRQGDFPEEGATSLRIESASPPGLAELTWALIGAIRRELERLGDREGAVTEYQRLAVHRPGERLRCRAGGKAWEGTFRGFDTEGFLRLEVGGREMHLSAGEVVEL